MVVLLKLEIMAKHLEYNHGRNEFAMDLLVMLGRVMLGPVIGIVAFARAPVEAKLFLAFMIL